MKSQIVTKGSHGSSQRQHGKWYYDACGTAYAMEVVGERWSLLVIRELMLGGKRFSDLRASLPGISAKVLTERLGSLEVAGVLVKRRLPPPDLDRSRGAVQLYELTEWGYMAEPAMQELGRWAARSPEHNPQLPLTPVSLMLSLRTMLDHQAAHALETSAGFTVGGESFLAELSGGEMPVRRAEPGEGAIGFAAPVALPLLRVFYGTDDPLAADARGDIAVRGEPDLVRRFVALFALPPKVALPGLADSA